MCRIAGLINPSLPVDSLQATVRSMCEILKHGGPDDEGLFTHAASSLALGHRRLSLLDLSPAGHQPMSYGEERFWVIFNGEIYNFIELREQLKTVGHQFHTTGDTEVILAAFAQWGTASFSMFNGMFAFALWDKHTNDVYLVRDGAGIKPLYYALTGNSLAFASEVRAFSAIPGFEEKHPDWPVFLMAYGHLPEPVTTLKHVKPLEKGSYLKYHIPSGKTVSESFNHYSYVERVTNRTEAISLVKDTLQAAVKRHLLSDAPIGVFLSGGLDSSILAKLADNCQARLNTISIFFKDAKYSEKKFQDMVQQGLSGNQFQQLITDTDFHAALPQIIKDMDLPSCDGVNTWFISKYARESGLKAVLSGIGGDELYGGYPSFKRIKAAIALAHLPASALRTGRYIGTKKFRRLSYLGIEGPVGKYLFLRGQFIPAEIAKHLDADESEIWKILEQEPVLPGIKQLTPGNQASWIEFNMYMQNQLLRDADAMSMAHGIEIRVPFLDGELIRQTLQLSSDVKYSGDRPKQLLIDSFKDILPEAIWNRPKMGFAFPFREWLSDNTQGVQLHRQHSIDYNAKFRSGQLHWSQYLTLLLMENHRDG